MIQWRPFAPWLTAALAILAGVYLQHRHDEDLAEQRAVTYVAVRAYQEARQEALGYEILANTATARADSIEHARQAAKPAVQKIVAAAPDTCKPVIAALEQQLASAETEAQDRKDAFTQQKQATAALAPAADHVADAATNLADKGKPSFLGRLMPEVGVGVWGGVSFIDRRPDVGVGVTLSWEIH